MTDIEKKTEEVMNQKVSKEELNSVSGGYACLKSSANPSDDSGKASGCFLGMVTPSCNRNSLF